MKNYVETTLQNAITECKKNGGRFWREDCPSLKLFIHPEWGIIDQITMGVHKIEVKDFELKWFYEQPVFLEKNQMTKKLNKDLREAVAEVFTSIGESNTLPERYKRALDIINTDPKAVERIYKAMENLKEYHAKK